MVARLASIAIDCRDPTVVGEFWAAVLGGELAIDSDGDALLVIAELPLRMDFLAVPESKTVKNRLHLDVTALDGDQAAELSRLLGLGARPVDIGQHFGEPRIEGREIVDWYVLADPEGNEFCLLAR